MADLFISHASEDLKATKVVADALKKSGWAVWYSNDSHSPTEHELQQAQMVVVLWTQFSTTDRYVIGEAKEALQNKILFPVFLEDVFLSGPFDEIDTINLIDWTGETSHPEYKRLVEKLSEVVKPMPGSADPDPEPVAMVEAPITQIREETEIPVDQPESLIEEEYENTLSPIPEKSTSRSSVSWLAPIKETLFRRKHLAYAGFAAFILIAGWKLFSNQPDSTQDDSNDPMVFYIPEKSGAEEPKKVGIAAKTITPDLAKSTSETEAVPAEAAARKEIQQAEPVEENTQEDTITAQPKVYYPPVQKGVDDEPIAEASLIPEQTTSAPKAPEEATDSLAKQMENEPVKTASLHAASGIGAEPRSEFSSGETVFIGATVYPTDIENYLLQWSTGDGQIIAEKRISTGKNTNGLNIYDSKKEFPGTTGRFTVRLYNNADQLLAETAFTVN